jgi:ADP-ribose pyrophosphatase YjhB (NUDIX family)
MLSSISWKQKVARLMRLSIFNFLMAWAIQMIVPRQRIGVSLVALDEEERIFMLRHVFHPTVPWGLPGGWLKRNEAPEVGILRELREETGLTAVLGPVVHIEFGKRPSHIGIAYLATLHPGSLKLSSEILEAQWFTMKDLPQPQYPFINKAIQAAIQMRRLMQQQEFTGAPTGSSR